MTRVRTVLAPSSRGHSAATPSILRPQQRSGAALRCARGLVGILALLLACAVSRAEDSSSERAAVPNSTKQAVALKQIREQYKAEYARKDASDQLALSKTFEQLAKEAGDDPPRRYVLLREARELAVDAGDFDQAFAAIDDMTRAFAIDGNELKVSALTIAMDKASIPPLQLMDNYLKASADALEKNDLLMAAQASMLASKIAVAQRDPVVKQRAKQMELRVHDARRELNLVVAAANKLKSKPEDADANLLVGRYLCFVQGSWEHGLPYLAKGSNKRLADLAGKDVESPSDALSMAALADLWWELPSTKETPQKRSHERAAYWYEQALPRLTGDAKSRAEQRIAEVKQTLH